MVIYSVTVSIDETIQQEWLNYMQKTHIPDVLNTGCFKEARLTRVMVKEDAGMTYSVQYLCENVDVLQHYADVHAPALQKEHKNKFEGKFAAFRTMLDVVEIFEPANKN